MGHVPAGPFRSHGEGRHLPRLQHRGTRTRSAGLTRRTRVARLGEDLAASFLVRRGARLLGRNLRQGRHEIDLLVSIGGLVIAVEVKTRVGAGEDPRAAFTTGKQSRVREAVARLERRVDRIDLVAVALTPQGADIRWVPQAS